MIPTEDSTFRHLVEQSPDGHFILVDGVFTYLNAAAKRMFGWEGDPPNELGVLDVVYPGDHERCQRNILLRQSGALIGASAYRGLRRNGEVFPIEVHTAPMGSSGTVALHGIVRDLSNRKEIEETLVRTEQSSLTARLMAGMSHDLSNLLTIIQTSADLLERENLGEESAQALARIHKAVRHSDKKLVQMSDLGMSQLEEQSPAPLWLNSLVDDVINLTRARWKTEANRVGVRYNISWLPGEALSVLAGSSDLRAAVVALIFNALDRMPHGGGLTIETGATAEGDCHITVTDEGAGLDETTVDELSDVFGSLQLGGKLGLGLHLVRRVAEDAGGHLEVAPRENGGSSFVLVLPPSEESPTEAETTLRFVDGEGRAASVPNSVRPKTSGARRLLVVDDQADLVQVLRTILEEKGFEVDVALRGRDGLAFVEALKYSAILTDLGMPDMSGWDFAARAKRAQPKTPVILMTGWAASIDEERLREEGVYALLPKPFRGKQLLDLLSKALASRREAASADSDA